MTSSQSPHARVAANSGILTGIALTAGGYAIFSIQDATVKWLAATYAVPQILFLRSLVIVAIALALGGRGGVRALARSRNKAPILLRAGLITVAWLFYYSASRYLGLAEMTTLYFAAPVIAVALAALVLKERVDASRWFVVLLGFAGVVVAAAPSRTMNLAPSLAVLAAACCWAASAILVRRIGRSDSTVTQMLAANLLSSIACLPALPSAWATPGASGLALMLGLGVIGGVGQYLLYEGFRFAPASVVAPIEYSGLVWAFLYGYAIWGDRPALHVYLGAALIAASSLTLVGFERRRHRRALRETVRP